MAEGLAVTKQMNTRPVLCDAAAGRRDAQTPPIDGNSLVPVIAAIVHEAGEAGLQDPPVWRTG